MDSTRRGLRRRDVLAAGVVLAAGACRKEDAMAASTTTTTTAGTTAGRMPVVFVGHGSPMNAVEDNAWSRGFAALGKTLPRPRAVLAISAHWHVPGTWLTANDRPPTIHDFGGFPQALFDMQYPAPGSADLVSRVRALAGERAQPSLKWGLDHGTWTVLHHVWPAADIPVVQLSMDERMAHREHLDLGARLAPLRDEGVLILASGNITHNLRHAMMSMRTGDTTIPAWSTSFDRRTEDALASRNTDALVTATETRDGQQSHPSVEHYLPLLYAAGASLAEDKVTWPVTGFDMGLSMRSVRWG